MSGNTDPIKHAMAKLLHALALASITAEKLMTVLTDPDASTMVTIALMPAQRLGDMLEEELVEYVPDAEINAMAAILEAVTADGPTATKDDVESGLHAKAIFAAAAAWTVPLGQALVDAVPVDQRPAMERDVKSAIAPLMLLAGQYAKANAQRTDAEPSPVAYKFMLLTIMELAARAVKIT